VNQLPSSFPTTEEERRIFTEGACYLLAYDLHKLTGFPVYVLGSQADNTPVPAGCEFPADGNWEHMAVQLPNQMLADVTGVYEAEELRQRHSWVASDDWFPVDLSQWKKLISGVCSRFEYADSASMAKKLAPC
jgi:hypothetical protein